MKQISFLALVIVICLQVTASFAEYGVLPLDNQIEQQIFDADNNTSMGMIYSSVDIRGTTLILKLTPNGKYRHEESLADLRRIMKIRVNQLYKSAGSNKRISKIVYYYQGKALTDEWSRNIIKDKETEENAGKSKQQIVSETQNYNVKREESCRFDDLDNEHIDYSDMEIPFTTLGLTLKVIDKEHIYRKVRTFNEAYNNQLAVEVFEQDDNNVPQTWLNIENSREVTRYIIREGHIPDGYANYWGDHGFMISIPYYKNKRNGIEYRFQNEFITQVTPYKADKVTGLVKLYSESDGKLIKTISYVNSIKHGYQKEYDENGKITKVIHYKNGEVIVP